MAQPMVRTERSVDVVANGPVPGVSGLAALKLWRRFEADSLRTLEEIVEQYGDVARMNLGFVDLYLVTHPDGVRRVLQENHSNYNKDTFDYRALREIDGDGLLTSDGPKWLRQRRIMQPAFHRERIAGFGEGMAQRIQVMCDEWETFAKTGRPFDLQQELQKLTLDVVTGALFGTNLGSRGYEVGDAFADVNQAALENMFSPISAISPKLGMWLNRKGTRAIKRINDLVLEIIAERRRTGEDRGDLLSMLLDARYEETGEGMSDQQLRSEVLILMLAGHETTMNALCWVFYLLAKHPEQTAKLRAESQEVLGGRMPTMKDVAELRYTRMVLDESMRIYPPAWATSRAALGADTVSGYPIPKGAVVFLSQWATHRHPDFWEDPERFDPERFSPERIESRHKYAYFPFGGGPRLCIGNTFSITEAVMTMAAVLGRFEMRLDPPDHVAELEPLITLRPKGGMPVAVSTL